MKLPNNEIGISDLLAHLDCPRRMAFGMRRHSQQGDAPEAQSPQTAYGSCIHDVLHLIEKDGKSDKEAVDEAFQKWGAWLEPDDVTRLFRDIDTYHQRRPSGVLTVANETEVRIPLMEWEGETIYFRCRLDRVYQDASDETRFTHVDYKSSKYQKSQEEVDEDPQLWAYNWAIFEHWPECEHLEQVYDQLRYGEVRTRKSEEQREQMRDWLKTAARAVLLDRQQRPRFNRWCPWCPIAYDCPVIPQLSDYALSRIAALAPQEKQGRKKVVKLDPALYDVYVNELPKLATARKTLEKVEEEIRRTLKEMPADKLAEYGFTPSYRSATVFTADSLRMLHERLGDEQFYKLVGVAKSRLESELRDEPELLDEALSMAEERDGAVVLTGGPQLE